MSFFKLFKSNKWIAGSALILSVSATTLAPRTSHALIGVATANVPVMIAGGCLMATSISTMFVAPFVIDGEMPMALGNFVGASLFLGIVILPNSSGYGYHYEAIRTSEMRDRFGLTDGQAQSFNRSLSRINAVVNEIEGELARPNVTYTEQEAMHLAKEVWTARLDDFNSDTQTALHNINSVVFSRH